MKIVTPHFSMRQIFSGFKKRKKISPKGSKVSYGIILLKTNELILFKGSGKDSKYLKRKVFGTFQGPHIWVHIKSYKLCGWGRGWLCGETNSINKKVM